METGIYLGATISAVGSSWVRLGQGWVARDVVGVKAPDRSSIGRPPASKPSVKRHVAHCVMATTSANPAEMANATTVRRSQVRFKL